MALTARHVGSNLRLLVAGHADGSNRRTTITAKATSFVSRAAVAAMLVLRFPYLARASCFTPSGVVLKTASETSYRRCIPSIDPESAHITYSQAGDMCHRKTLMPISIMTHDITKTSGDQLGMSHPNRAALTAPSSTAAQNAIAGPALSGLTNIVITTRAPPTKKPHIQGGCTYSSTLLRLA